MTRLLRHAAGQRGSASPVAIYLLMVVMLLLMVFLDREWVNHKLHMAEQTADFAAEAASKTAEIWYTLEVHMYTTVRWMARAPGCTDAECPVVPYSANVPRSVSVTAKEEDLKLHWRELAGCGSNSEDGNYRCASLTISEPEVRYPSRALSVGEGVFRANWLNQPAATEGGVEVTAVGSTRKVSVNVTLRVTSLTGVFGWNRAVTISGSAITQPVKLQITI